MPQSMRAYVIFGFLLVVFLLPTAVSAGGRHLLATRFTWHPFIDNHKSRLFYRATGEAIGAGGSVIVADAGSHRVRVFSSSGVPVRSIGSDVASSKLFFHGPYGVATDTSGNIYVADDGIIKMSPTGAFLARWSIGVTANLTAVAVDSHGSVYAAGLHAVPHYDLYDTITIQKFSPVGKSIWAKPYVVSYPDSAGDAALAASIAVNPANQLFLSIKGQKYCHSCNGIYFTLQQISANGKKTDELATPAGGTSFGFDPAGNMYLAKAHKVYQLDPMGTQTAVFGAPGCGPSQLGANLRVAATADGNFFVADSQQSVVKMTDGVLHHFLSGTLTMLYGTCPSGTPTFQQLDSLTASSTNVFVDDVVGEKIVRYSVAGKKLGSFATGHVSNITIDKQGNLYYAVRGALQKHSPTGTLLGKTSSQSIEASVVATGGTIYALTVDGQVVVLPAIGKGTKPIRRWWLKGWAAHQGGNAPTGITLDSTGNVWVADNRHNNIQVYTPNGKLVHMFGEQGSGAGQFMKPGALTADGKGYVFVVDFGNNRIQEFNVQGKWVASFGREGQASGQLIQPRGIAMGKHGALYVGDAGNDRVQALLP